jgi:hypothetical protein
MAGSRKTTVTKEQVEEIPLESENSQVVLAYRVGRLEKAQELGFGHISDELKDLKAGFVTNKQLAEEVDKAKLIHESMDLARVNADNSLDSRLKRIEDIFSLISKIIIWTLVLSILAGIGLRSFGIQL